MTEKTQSSSVKRIIERAYLEADADGVGEVSDVHLLSAILQEPRGTASQFLKEKVITLEAVRALDFRRQ